MVEIKLSSVKRLMDLNVIAIIGVVFHHALIWVLTSMVWWADRYMNVSVPYFESYGTPAFYALRVFDLLGPVAVPAFLFVSGRFIAFAGSGKQEGVTWKVAFGRIKTLLIPYLVWCLVYILYFATQGNIDTLPEMLRKIVTGQLIAPFYFVIVLVQLYLLSPLIFRAMRSHWGAVLAAAAVLQVAALFLHYASLLDWTFPGSELLTTLLLRWDMPGYAIWFVLGIAAGLNLPEVKSFLIKARPYLLAALVVITLLNLAEWQLWRVLAGMDWPSTQAMGTSKLMALVFLAWMMTTTVFDRFSLERIRPIGLKSYGIYLSHVLVLELTARAVYHLAPGLFAYPLVFLLILFLAGLLIPYAGMALMDHSPARRFSNLLFGH